MEVPSITKTEALILTALSSREQYGLAIIEKVEKISEMKVTLSLGGLYTTLHRMEHKGLLKSRWGEKTEVRQGARRRYYRITGLGSRALNDATEIFMFVINHGLNPVCFDPVYLDPIAVGAL
jgi:PadR family transcriptional regulator PadR